MHFKQHRSGLIAVDIILLGGCASTYRRWRSNCLWLEENYAPLLQQQRALSEQTVHGHVYIRGCVHVPERFGLHHWSRLHHQKFNEDHRMKNNHWFSKGRRFQVICKNIYVNPFGCLVYENMKEIFHIMYKYYFLILVTTEMVKQNFGNI